MFPLFVHLSIPRILNYCEGLEMLSLRKRLFFQKGRLRALSKMPVYFISSYKIAYTVIYFQIRSNHFINHSIHIHKR